MLALLVTTGLAGTLKHTSLTSQERKFAVNLMKDSKMSVLNSIKGLSDKQLNFKPSKEEWSISQYIEHIATSENSLWGWLDKTMRLPANPEKRSEVKFTDDSLIQMIKDCYNVPESARIFIPEKKKWKNTDQALADFKTQRTSHIKYLKSSTEDLRNHILQMPFGYIDAYQVSLVIVAYDNLLIEKINTVINNSRFPKS